jgi:ubiquinone biosynthesis protein Coq4
MLQILKIPFYYLEFSYKSLVRQLKVTFVVRVLQYLFPSPKHELQLEELRALEEGTVGRAIADFLDQHQLGLIPKFESHDLKHILLGYGASVEDELKMQAFLLGNGNRSLPCLMFISMGVLTPYLWKDLHKAFKRGQKAKSIFHLQIEDCQHLKLEEVRRQYRL